jgi:hypothetical protein
LIVGELSGHRRNKVFQVVTRVAEGFREFFPQSDHYFADIQGFQNNFKLMAIRWRADILIFSDNLKLDVNSFYAPPTPEPQHDNRCRPA